MKTELVTTLKRQATRILSELQEKKDTILITEHGRPAAYLVDVQTYERLCHKIRILEGIALGEKAVQNGQTITHEQAKMRMKRWLN